VILLARHGETADNAPPVRFMGSRDTPLSPRGEAQARDLAGAVAQEGLAVIWTSGLRRARQTAQIVAAALDVPVRVDARLAESHRGDWEGRLVTDLEREEPEDWAAWRRAGAGFRFPGGESLGEHQARVLDVLVDIAAGPQPALVISHGGTIRSAFAATRPGGLDAFHDLDVPHAVVIPFEESALAASP
jgi:broad specificity phosphatase PhoE